MKMSFKFIGYLLIFNYSFAYSLDLKLADKRPIVASISDPTYVLSRKIEIVIANSPTADPNKKNRTLGFANLNNGSDYFAVSRTPYIHQVNPSSGAYMGGWPVASFTDASLEPEINAIYEMHNIKSDILTISNPTTLLGCLAQNPVRYGELNGDKTSKLIIFEQDKFGALNTTVFSPELKKAIFSLRLATYDTHKNDRQTLLPGQEPLLTDPLANAPTDGQYLSLIAEEHSGQIRGIQKAVINFSKLYLFDADGDTKQDLIVWRKLYQSRENKDSIKGYVLLRDQAIFYKLDAGEYKKQPTDSATIKSWLTTKQLTWQKGYPSKSECKGQEGQLIPEFHDPLLNDPDVLK